MMSDFEMRTAEEVLETPDLSAMGQSRRGLRLGTVLLRSPGVAVAAAILVLWVVIAIVLGGLAQKTFHQTLMLWGYKGFFIRPISLGLFIITVAMVFLPYLRARRRRRRVS